MNKFVVRKFLNGPRRSIETYMHATYNKESKGKRGKKINFWVMQGSDISRVSC